MTEHTELDILDRASKVGNELKEYAEKEGNKKKQITVSFNDLRELMIRLRYVGVKPPEWLLEQHNNVTQEVEERIMKKILELDNTL